MRLFSLFVIFLFAQITLQGDQDQSHAGAVLGNLADPFTFDVLEGIGRIDAEAEHDGVGVIVGEGSESVEFFLTGSIPEGQLDVDIIDEDVVDVVFEDGGFAGGEAVRMVYRGEWSETH
jgi:hypothetical protein